MDGAETGFAMGTAAAHEKAADAADQGCAKAGIKRVTQALGG
jgi:hypothetical protein